MKSEKPKAKDFSFYLSVRLGLFVNKPPRRTAANGGRRCLRLGVTVPDFTSHLQESFTQNAAANAARMQESLQRRENCRKLKQSRRNFIEAAVTEGDLFLFYFPAFSPLLGESRQFEFECTTNGRFIVSICCISPCQLPADNLCKFQTICFASVSASHTFAYSLCQLISWLSTEISDEMCVEDTDA